MSGNPFNMPPHQGQNGTQRGAFKPLQPRPGVPSMPFTPLTPQPGQFPLPQQTGLSHGQQIFRNNPANVAPQPLPAPQPGRPLTLPTQPQQYSNPQQSRFPSPTQSIAALRSSLGRGQSPSPLPYSSVPMPSRGPFTSVGQRAGVAPVTGLNTGMVGAGAMGKGVPGAGVGGVGARQPGMPGAIISPQNLPYTPDQLRQMYAQVLLQWRRMKKLKEIQQRMPEKKFPQAALLLDWFATVDIQKLQACLHQKQFHHLVHVFQSLKRVPEPPELKAVYIPLDKMLEKDKERILSHAVPPPTPATQGPFSAAAQGVPPAVATPSPKGTHTDSPAPEDRDVKPSQEEDETAPAGQEKSSDWFDVIVEDHENEGEEGDAEASTVDAESVTSSARKVARLPSHTHEDRKLCRTLLRNFIKERGTANHVTGVTAEAVDLLLEAFDGRFSNVLERLYAISLQRTSSRLATARNAHVTGDPAAALTELNARHAKAHELRRAAAVTKEAERRRKEEEKARVREEQRKARARELEKEKAEGREKERRRRGEREKEKEKGKDKSESDEDPFEVALRAKNERRRELEKQAAARAREVERSSRHQQQRSEQNTNAHLAELRVRRKERRAQKAHAAGAGEGGAGDEGDRSGRGGLRQSRSAGAGGAQGPGEGTVSEKDEAEDSMSELSGCEEPSSPMAVDTADPTEEKAVRPDVYARIRQRFALPPYGFLRPREFGVKRQAPELNRVSIAQADLTVYMEREHQTKRSKLLHRLQFGVP